MSITDIEQRCNALRNDLKAWEKQFASQHNGSRAGREDIKADVVISQKYKEYNKLRAQPATKSAPRTPSKRTASRKQAVDVAQTPKAPLLTPLKRKREETVHAEEVGAVSEYLSPQGPAFIGPTPQRDGIVLGLFDSLSAETPSKRRIIFGEIEPNLFQTPTKKDTEEVASETSSASRIRGDRTPLSITKRNLFNQFVTPKKRSLDEEGTPTSALKGLATPAFLRRDNALDRIEEADEITPRVAPAPWKRRGMVRSLSAMIQSMRKDEDDRLDEEADIMRELEMEEEVLPAPGRPRVAHVQVADSQAEMPLGPDRGSESEEEVEEEAGPDGKPRRVWKKKGLKRQTRRTNLRPNGAKPKPIPEFQHDEDSGTEPNTIPETGGQADLESAECDSDYASDVSHSERKRKVPANKVVKPTEKQEGVVEKVKRKIAATAHANYQRLKIKGKGGNGGNPKGRYGRR
ncbi:DNA replication regulator SLD2 [Boeremia exigua]|uniref:DNA replication regulator SLD2 n=1 Tax=Boeremia exigua TaxID=749465 RepID=UPI001E8CF701|nr:DNA replication regulator SLD2 [Boeremia exigua]KAH6643953.1 DNA replication regulator SLD2 [Boeremia exigua]